jgi:CheY-like chemotaxis protein
MPEVDGVTATAEIRNMVQKKDFPYIIALTANTEKDVKTQCLHSGFNAFLGKPFKMDVLDQVIREAPAFRP